jgi:hypothetical protein
MRFEIVEETAKADVVVIFTPTITTCNGETTEGTFYYCSEGRIFSDSPEQAVLQIPTAFRDDAVKKLLNAGIAALSGQDPKDTAILSYDSRSEYLYHDPWPGAGPVTVSVNSSVSPDRSFVPLVRESLDYWRANQSRFGDYEVEWVIESENTEADVEVRVVDEVKRCDESTEDVLGCAPLLNPTTQAADREVVRVVDGLSDASTVEVLKHEFGHIYGREHGEEPMPLMSNSTVATTLPQPNVSEREYAFSSAPLEVYVDYSTFSEQDSTVRAEINRAIEYYNDHPGEYRPDDVSLSLTDNESAAEVVVQQQSISCSSDGGCSNVSRFGTDPDGDGALETYSTMYISLSDLDEEVYGWHTGYWLALAFQAYPRSDVFAPDTDYDGRRNW